MATGRLLGIMTLLLNITRWLSFYHIFPQAKSVDVWELSQEDLMKFIVFYRNYSGTAGKSLPLIIVKDSGC